MDAVGCPRCGAPPGTWCTTYLLHVPRVELIRRPLTTPRTSQEVA
ncbi:zinc finger domain-containing protein [Mycolicibacterium farcinogenes]